MNFDDKKAFIINFIYLLIWIFLIYFIFTVAAVYLMPFLIGLLIAYFVQKPAKFFEKKTKISKRICAALLSVFFYIFILIILILIIWVVFSQGERLLNFISTNEKLNRFLENTFKTMTDSYNKNNVAVDNLLRETVNELIQRISVYATKIVTDLMKNAPSFLLSSIVTIVATCFISKDFDRFNMFLKGFLSKKTQKIIIDIKNIFVEYFLKFSIAYLLMFALTFIILLFGLLILNPSHLIITAFLISLIDLLPVFGTGIVLLPWAIMEIIQYNYFKGIGLVALYLIISIVKNFIEPKIVGKQIDVNPIFTLIFIFLGLKIGGIIGMIVLPVVLTVLFNYFRKQINQA